MNKSQLWALQAASVVVISGLATADIWFTHDQNVLALPPLPANGVFNAPDVQDVFYSPTFIRSAPGPNQGNALVLNNPAILGLRDGDNIDAIHHELRELGTDYDSFPAFVFSVNAGDIGYPGTNVRSQAPNNAADLYESNGFGYNVVDVNENQIGLAPGIRTDVDGVFLTPTSEISSARWVYFSLTPGSPTLAALGASPADILSAQVGGIPRISIRAKTIGLDPIDDDLDALIMLDGVDANGNGTFDEADEGDSFPMVIFSVSNSSFGLPNTGVSNERIIDAPVGGDVYFSLGQELNHLFMDDGQYGLGLDDKDELDALDLPSMAVPWNTPGGLGVPFSGGSTTPGAPGTPGGPPLPTPGGTGGPPGCAPVSMLRIGLCLQSFSTGTCKIEVRVFVSCVSGSDNTLSTGDIPVKCDDGNSANGSEIVEAVKAIENALRGLKFTDGPDAGKPVFAGPGAVVSPTPTHTNVNMPVNGALTDCKVTGFATILNGCDCYTQNVKVLAWVGEEPVDWEEPAKVVIDIDKEHARGLYMLQVGENDEPKYIPTPGGSAETVSRHLATEIREMGYAVNIDESQSAIEILENLDGKPVSEIWGAGFVAGGSGHHTLRVETGLEHECACDLNHDHVVDYLDVLIMVDQMHSNQGESSQLDFDNSGSVNYFDLSHMMNTLGSCQ